MFGFGRKRQPVTNVDVHTTVEYSMDPRGHALFAGLSRANHHFLTDVPAVIGSDDNWSGWTKPQQTMRGMSNLGQGRPVLPAGSTLDQEHSSTITDPATAIFGRRLAARSGKKR